MTFTLVMAVYGQPEILTKQLETISRYDDEVLDSLHIRIVDDHGTPPVAENQMIQSMAQHTDIRVYRVEEDIPWNQMGARNIGMREAPAGPCVMLDPDMIIEPGMIRRFIRNAGRLPRGWVIKFGLRHASGRKEVDMSSPNTWMIHKDDFFAAGGYDEEFRGHKGWSDCLLQETLRALYRVKQRPDLWVRFYIPSDGPKDSQVAESAGVGRSVKHNKELKRRKNALIDRMGGFKRYIGRGLKPKNFRSKWTRTV